MPEVLTVYARTLAREAHVLARFPSLPWQQLHKPASMGGHHRLSHADRRAGSGVAANRQSVGAPWHTALGGCGIGPYPCRPNSAGDRLRVQLRRSADRFRQRGLHLQSVGRGDRDRIAHTGLPPCEFVLACGFSPDGRRIVSGSGYGFLKGRTPIPGPDQDLGPPASPDANLRL
jgi:hypothetical protein